MNFWVSTGAMVAVVLDAVSRWWQHRQAAQRRSAAVAVLKKHGLSPTLYLATLGVDDDELRRALDELTSSGHIIMNPKGEVVGRICSSVVKRPPLRLVVSND